jgi:hypothetical protein
MSLDEVISEEEKQYGTITWTLPKSSTMLKTSIASDTKDWTVITTDTEIKYSKSITSENDLQFPYKIKKIYTPSYKNNRIKCVITALGGMVYSNSRSFSFGIKGNSGTEYTLLATPVADTMDMRKTLVFPDNHKNDPGETTYYTEIKF